MRNGSKLLLVLATSLTLTACGGNSYSEISWTDLELGEVVPAPSDKVTGEVQVDSDESLQVVVAKTSKESFAEYVELCEENGFDLNSYSVDDYYSADDASGYGLSISLDTKSKTMTISVNGYNVYGEFTWPDSDIAKLLPVPKSNYGVVEWEKSEGFVADVANTSIDDFNEYVSACKENGFTIDYQAGDDYYYADDESGNKLTLNYKDGDIMFVRIDAPNEEESEASNVTETTSVDKSNQENSEQNNDTGIRPEFKEAMDSYEKFIDEYCEFMKKYNSSSNVSAMATDYANYMTQYVNMMNKIEKIGDEEMSSEEAVYYAEVTARTSKKILEAGIETQ